MKATRRHLTLSIIVVFLFISSVITYGFVTFTINFQKFSQEHDNFDLLMKKVAQKPPEQFTTKQWETLCELVTTTYVNAAYHISDDPEILPKMRTFRTDVEKRLDESDEVDYETLQWILTRMEVFDWRLEYVKNMQGYMNDIRESF